VPSVDPNVKVKLRLAYDADAERRNARNPEAWRFESVDDLVDRMQRADLFSVLDVGCGTGQIAERMASRGLEVTGVDLAPANVMCTQARGVASLVGDFHELPFDDASFDAALAFNSLLHVPKSDLGGVIAEIRRVLVTGGFAKIIVWGGFDHEGPHDEDWLTPPRFFSFFTDEDFAALETPGFEEIETLFLHDQGDSDGLHPQTKLLRAT
jgi:SAM-dependent methyltransferase